MQHLSKKFPLEIQSTSKEEIRSYFENKTTTINDMVFIVILLPLKVYKSYPPPTPINSQNISHDIFFTYSHIVLTIQF